MKDPRFNKAIRDIQKISMTAVEKQAVLERVMSRVTSNVATKHATKSPWTVYSFGSWIQSHRWISALAVVVLVIFAGNSAVLASYDALPGDALYSVKVSIVEPIRVALAPTPIAKAEIQAQLVQTRLQEVETLVARGTLTDAKEKEINQRIEKQTLALATNVSSVKATAPEKAQDINTTVEASLNTHERILAVLAPHRDRVRKTPAQIAPAVRVNNPEQSDTVVIARATAPVAPQVVTVPAVQMMSVASTPSAGIAPAAVSAPLTTGAALSAPVAAPVPVVPVQVVEPVVQVKKVPARIVKKNLEYEKRKIQLESLIQTASSTIATTTSTATSTTIQKAILLEAQSTLDQARGQLLDADKHDQDGEIEQSYSALMDSERSIKETSLLLKAKSRLEKDKKRSAIDL